MSPTRGSHGPSLLRLAQREVQDGQLVRRGEHVLVAVSGGPDSNALLHVMSILGRRNGFRVSACGVNHGLRLDAAQELELGAKLADDVGVAWRTVALCVAPGANLMARAREARLAALRSVARESGAQAIALAHHADDRAETVLMRIMRGTGPAGLAVLPPRARDLVRPLIRARRTDVLRHLQRHGIAYARDPSNEDRRFLRAAVRADVLPVLERLAPRVVEHLCDLADDACALGLAPSPRGHGRVHRQAMARALAAGNATARIALPGGRIARFDPSTGQIAVDPCDLSQEGDAPTPTLQQDHGRA
ncbi:MAG: tRNA lysidine(34) synthetase TilS [Polyangiaceae bacterium]|nr:tRNA lysidine(34) synthetase TilS [Polyangiaceae bacterium]